MTSIAAVLASRPGGKDDEWTQADVGASMCSDENHAAGREEDIDGELEAISETSVEGHASPRERGYNIHFSIEDARVREREVSTAQELGRRQREAGEERRRRRQKEADRERQRQQQRRRGLEQE